MCKTVKKMSQKIRFSFISMGKKDRGNSPSEATKELIKHIHAGFDPYEQSVKRWAIENEKQKKKDEEDREELIEVYEKYNKDHQEILERKMKRLNNFIFEKPNPLP